MGKLIERARRHDDGFTLIELLIVIIILGVLAAIVVLSVAGVTNNSKTVACKASVETIDTAAEAFIANGGAGPASGLTLSQLSPAFLHSIPSTVGSTATSGATTVGAVDAIVC